MSQTLVEFTNMELQLLQNSKTSSAYKYKKWFVANAELFTEVDLIKSEELAKHYQCKIKQCYLNVWRAVTSDYKMEYYEGFVISDSCPIPIEHCWGVIDGIVIDPTLIIDVESYKNRVGSEYYGIKLPKKFVLKQGLKTKKAGAFIFDYWWEQRA